MLYRSGPWGYNLDNFSGEIDPEIQEFQSLNNDGGRDVDGDGRPDLLVAAPFSDVGAPQDGGEVDLLTGLSW